MIAVENRIKHEVVKAVASSILKAAGYRLVSSGMENAIREVACLSDAEYEALDLPMVTRVVPDFVVLDRDCRHHQMVEVKYRASVDGRLIPKLEFQLDHHSAFTLILMYGAGVIGKTVGPFGQFLRCCELRKRDGFYEMRARTPAGTLVWWTLSVGGQPSFWDSMCSLADVFPGTLNADRETQAIVDNLALSLARRVP